jgi:hypothetical protein
MKLTKGGEKCRIIAIRTVNRGIISRTPTLLTNNTLLKFVKSEYLSRIVIIPYGKMKLLKKHASHIPPFPSTCKSLALCSGYQR